MLVRLSICTSSSRQPAGPDLTPTKDSAISRASLSRLYLLAVLWGSGFLFVKLALRGLSPVQVVLGQLGFGAVVLLATLAVRRQSLPHVPREWAIWQASRSWRTSRRTCCSRGASSGSARASPAY